MNLKMQKPFFIKGFKDNILPLVDEIRTLSDEDKCEIIELLSVIKEIII